MNFRVFAITSVYEDHGLFPHFLDHYARLGVHRVLVVVRTPVPDVLFPLALEAAGPYAADVRWFPCDRFEDTEKAAVERSVLIDAGVSQDDYVMYLDLDEFHEYPAPLNEIVRKLKRRNQAVRGWLVDRVAEDGVLAPVREGPDIGAQFPIGCDLTEKLLGGWTQKIMLCPAWASPRNGVNHDVLGVKYDLVPVGDAGDYVVHHFKWTEGVDARLRARLVAAALGLEYLRECQKFLECLESQGKIDVCDPTLRSRLLGPLTRR